MIGDKTVSKGSAARVRKDISKSTGSASHFALCVPASGRATILLVTYSRAFRQSEMKH